jgi:PBP1b-binding outer membrane lipoprotein LpoB
MKKIILVISLVLIGLFLLGCTEETTNQTFSSNNNTQTNNLPSNTNINPCNLINLQIDNITIELGETNYAPLLITNNSSNDFVIDWDVLSFKDSPTQQGIQFNKQERTYNNIPEEIRIFNGTQEIPERVVKANSTGKIIYPVESYNLEKYKNTTIIAIAKVKGLIKNETFCDYGDIEEKSFIISIK